MAAASIDVIAAILESCQNGLSKKVLQSKIGLAPDLLDKHLFLLESKNLVRLLHDDKGKNESIIITQRGAKFLEMYQAIRAKYLSISASK